MQGDNWRNAIALIKTFDDPGNSGRSEDQATDDRVRILQNSEPREVALALAGMASTLLRQLGEQGFDTESFFAEILAAAERRLDGM